MLFYKRKKIKFKRLKCVLLSIVLVLVLIIVFCEQQLAEFKCEYIRIQAEIISVNSVCEAVNSSIRSFNYNYDDLAKIQYSKDGKVQAIKKDFDGPQFFMLKRDTANREIWSVTLKDVVEDVQLRFIEPLNSVFAVTPGNLLRSGK